MLLSATKTGLMCHQVTAFSLVSVLILHMYACFVLVCLFVFSRQQVSLRVMEEFVFSSQESDSRLGFPLRTTSECDIIKPDIHEGCNDWRVS